jgi:hypothetical protein
LPFIFIVLDIYYQPPGMRKRIALLQRLALTLLPFFCATLLSSQVTIYSPHITGDPDQNVKVEIKVSDFDNMVSTQFSLHYDSLVLSYVNVGDFGIFNINLQNNFGVPAGGFSTPKGIITFLWIADNIITGQSMPDSATLFSITFKIIGSSGQKSPITFTDTPTDIEFGNLGGETDYVAFNGMVTVSGGSSTEEIVTQDFTFFPLSPNPANGETVQARFFLRKSAQARLEVFDITGNLVYQETHHSLGSGMHALAIPAERYPAPGTYLVRLTTDNAQAVQQLIVVR